MKKETVAAAIALPFITATGLLDASERLYKFVFNRVNEVPPTSEDKQKYADQYYGYVDWLRTQPTRTWILNQNTDEELSAVFVPAANPSKDTVIVAHGYKGNGETMANYAKMFHDLGFNVLLPDSRAHGNSAGKYITFGWLDRLDYLDWIAKIISYGGQDSRIVLFGVSMGGATVEMLSGEDLPAQVKLIIADCGYSDINSELTYLLKQLYHMPKYPIVPAVSLINKRRQGFDLKQVSSINQLAKNKLPIFFIHGEKDVYVPTAMVEENYAATKGPKQKWIVPDATHAESFWINPEEYRQRVQSFLDEYLI